MALNNFKTAFTDKNGVRIKVGDTIKIELENEIEEYHYEERYDMMENSRPVKVVTKINKIKGWVKYKVKWSGSCVIAERIKDSGGITSSFSYYLNSVFKGEDFEIVNDDNSFV
jgi:hypothetical protein